MCSCVPWASGGAGSIDVKSLLNNHQFHAPWAIFVWFRDATWFVIALIYSWHSAPTQSFPQQSHRFLLRLQPLLHHPSNPSTSLAIPDRPMHREPRLPRAYTLHPHLCPPRPLLKTVRQLDCSFAPGSRQVHALAGRRAMTERRQ